MTLLTWEKQFSSALKGLTKQEKVAAVEYYRELYGDKIDAGESPEHILAEFGNPVDCAQKILAEHKASKKDNADMELSVENVSVHSVSSIIGMVFLTLLLIIPLYAVIAAVIASLGAGAISAVVVAIAGALATLISPVFLIVNGASWQAVFANVGLCIGSIGVSVFLFIGFYFLTKYAIKGAVKLFKLIYFKGEKA